MKKTMTLCMALACIGLCSWAKKPTPTLVKFTHWRFNTGDDLRWAAPNFNDSQWKSISTAQNWESQGFDNYDGYAWYRTSASLPQRLRLTAFLHDSVKIDLGKIDDCDETYLNGHLLGKNGKIVNENDASVFDKNVFPYNVHRVYKLAASDKRLNWNGENTIAVRVRDFSGPGGMYVANTYLSMVGLEDYLTLNDKMPLQRSTNNSYKKNIELKNLSGEGVISGKLMVMIRDINTNKACVNYSYKVKIEPGMTSILTIEIPAMEDQQLMASYCFEESSTRATVEKWQDLPYILTPKAPDTARINGPRIFGVRPGSPFFYRIPASGIRPMHYDAQNLPAGLSIDHETGIIRGKLSVEGKYTITLVASNKLGVAKKAFDIAVGNKLSLTPPMGWNSWNVWGLAVDNDKVRDAANSFIASGLADYGYTYINIDDGWEAPQRDASGEIMTNGKFPDMKATADYVHSKGLRFGIYSSPGTVTCGGYLGSFMNEEQDAKTYAHWGGGLFKI